jgi:transcriptional regulator with GAF, ATPase, and Fis domain
MATTPDNEAGGNYAIADNAARARDAEPHNLKEILEQVERDLILNALRASHGNKAQAARELGITERLIGLRVRRLGIDWRSLRVRRRFAERSYQNDALR